MDRIQGIVKEIESNLYDLRQKSKTIQVQNLVSEWLKRTREEPKRFINPDLTINKSALENFRRLSIFVRDVPDFDPVFWNPKNIVSGSRKGARKLLLDCLNTIIKNNYEYLLKKYPCSLVGNPYIFKYKSYKYTYTWTRHIYFLGRFKDVLGRCMEDGFITLDIGSSYGVFSYLFKNEFSKCHCILLDFPEQLVLAHYFIAMNMPMASIATFREVLNAEHLDRDFFSQYDFILIPLTSYKDISANSVDLVTNFASFSEMQRPWFEHYIENEPFISAKYFLTANRFQSAPIYDSDITILDFHLERFKKLHFAIDQMARYVYKRKFFFFYNIQPNTSQFFEFIGERE